MERDPFFLRPQSCIKNSSYLLVIGRNQFRNLSSFENLPFKKITKKVENEKIVLCSAEPELSNDTSVVLLFIDVSLTFAT